MNWNNPWQNSFFFWQYWLVICLWQARIKFLKVLRKSVKNKKIARNQRVCCRHCRIYSWNSRACLLENAWRHWHKGTARTFFLQRLWKLRVSDAYLFSNEKKKATEDDTDIDTELITVYNFFAHLIEEFNVTKNGKDRQLIQTFSPYETYQYSDGMLKQLSEKSLKKLRKTLLYSNKPVVYNKNTIDSGTCNSTTPADVTDDNLDKRITLFQN